MNLLKTDFAVIGDSDTLPSTFPLDAGDGGIEILADELVFETPYGQSPVFRLFALDGRQVITCRMQGELALSSQSDEARQVFWVLREVGVKRIIAQGSVRAINQLLDPGDVVIPQDYLNLSPYKDIYLEEQRWLIMDDALCPEVRQQLVLSGRAQCNGRIFSRGIYAASNGCHRESPAELALLKGHADIRGHRLCPEVYLAREIGACYAGMYVVAGQQAGADASLVTPIIIGAIRNLAVLGKCDCKALSKETQ